MFSGEGVFSGEDRVLLWVRHPRVFVAVLLNSASLLPPFERCNVRSDCFSEINLK